MSISLSDTFDFERVFEISRNERYIRLNLVLGKGGYKVVYEAIDREEGHEVAWNICRAFVPSTTTKWSSKSVS